MKPCSFRLVAALWLLWAPGSQAQAPEPTPAPVAATALPPAEVASGVPAPVLVGCGPVSDKAMSTDMAAVTAQSKKADLNEQAKLFTEAIELWLQAAQQCDGRAKERAMRSRDDDQQALNQIREALGAGPQCASGQKDAAALQDIAKQALTERRWAEAASLFRKAENMWDYAAERCTGSQQEVANRRREQSAQDGHNAQFCAPLFEQARETTQKLRSAAASLSREDKQEASMVAETLWREALEHCRGVAVQDIASNNAKALARERGTPWVPRLPPAEPVQASAPRPAATQALTRPATGSTSALAMLPAAAAVPAVIATAPTQAVVAVTPSVLNVAAPTVQAAVTPLALASPSAPTLAPASVPAPAPAPALAPAPAPQIAEPLKPALAATPGVLMAGSTRFAGQFARDVDATTISGSGKVSWATGDVFEGTLVKGLRHGTGTIVWANGQRYAGDWVHDKPTGQAQMHFANGNDYQGRVVDGVPQGPGKMRYASGDEFDGVFKDGEPHERGTYVWLNGQRYEGAWINGRPNGVGKLKFATGNQFEGDVVNGVPQGKGRMLFSGGEVYEGQFSAGEPDGQGTFRWPSGDQYSGQWRAGKKHGKGVFTWKAGDRWEGEYDNDVQKN